MSISTTATKDSYAGNNSIVTQYPITFKYFEESHISVYFDGVLQTKGAGADYVMGGDGTTSTGYITTNVAQADTVTVAITLDVPFDQPVVLQETGSLPAKTIEVEGFDRLNMQVRRVWRKLQDVLTFNTDEAGASTGTADNLIGFDGSGDIAEIPNTTFLQQDNNLSELANAPDQAAAQTNLNVDPAGTDNSTDVTKTGAGTYVSLAGQVLTVDAITESDISDLGAYIENVTGSPLSELQDVTITTPSTSQVLAWNGSAWVNTSAGNGDALTTSGLDQFAATTSLQLKNTITDETGTGSLVFATSPALVTPDLGTPSAADLTNATNYPESNGTVQSGALEVKAANEGTVAGDARGGRSVDLQMRRELSTQVASGLNSALLGGQNNTASGTNSAVLGGVTNVADGVSSVVFGSQNVSSGGGARNSILGGISSDITSTADNNTVIGGIHNLISGSSSHGIVAGGNNNEVAGGSCGILAGQRHVVSGVTAVSLGGSDCVASGGTSIVAGNTGSATHQGSRVFADQSATAFPSIADQEFAVQASALRLDDGNQGAGKILTCDANGSGNWAAPAKVVYTVATLPATPAQGDVAIVTDALAPAFLSAVADTGAVVTPVFWNGTAWIVG